MLLYLWVFDFSSLPASLSAFGWYKSPAGVATIKKLYVIVLRYDRLNIYVSTKIHALRPNPNAMVLGGLCEVIRSWGGPLEWDSRGPEELPHEAPSTARRHSENMAFLRTRKQVFNRH